MITTAGKLELANAILSYVEDMFGYFSVGTGSSTESSSDTDLESPIEWQTGTNIYRKKVDEILFDGNNIIFRCRLRFNEFNTDSGSCEIWEIGIFSRLHGGVMLLRKVFSAAISKNSNTEKIIDVKLRLW